MLASFLGAWSSEVAKKVSKENYQYIKEKGCDKCMPEWIKRIMLRKVNNKSLAIDLYHG